jgi:glycosyltransferase involved in cell wall biosynthesis
VRIVGAGITRELAVEWSRHEHVVPVGWAPDLGPEFARARAFVAPLPNGAGVKTKILLALSAGLPVVTNRFGAEGMGVEPGRHLLVAETPREIADAVARVVADDELWTGLSRAGREWALEESGPGPAQRAFREAVASVTGA